MDIFADHNLGIGLETRRVCPMTTNLLLHACEQWLDGESIVGRLVTYFPWYENIHAGTPYQERITFLSNAAEDFENFIWSNSGHRNVRNLLETPQHVYPAGTIDTNTIAGASEGDAHLVDTGGHLDAPPIVGLAPNSVSLGPYDGTPARLSLASLMDPSVTPSGTDTPSYISGGEETMEQVFMIYHKKDTTYKGQTRGRRDDWRSYQYTTSASSSGYEPPHLRGRSPTEQKKKR